MIDGESPTSVPPRVSSLDAAWRCCAPTQHLSESDLHHVVEAMPPALQRLFRPCTQHQTAYGPEGFLRRVAAHLDLTPPCTNG